MISWNDVIFHTWKEEWDWEIMRWSLNVYRRCGCTKVSGVNGWESVHPAASYIIYSQQIQWYKAMEGNTQAHPGDWLLHDMWPKQQPLVERQGKQCITKEHMGDDSAKASKRRVGNGHMVISDTQQRQPIMEFEVEMSPSHGKQATHMEHRYDDMHPVWIRTGDDFHLFYECPYSTNVINESLHLRQFLLSELVLLTGWSRVASRNDQGKLQPLGIALGTIDDNVVGNMEGGKWEKKERHSSNVGTNMLQIDASAW